MNRYYSLGKTADGNVFRLTDEDLNRHVAVFGDIGSGKSRLLWQLLREHRRNRRGFCLIDPGDLWCDFLADCAREVLRTGDRGLLQKVHFLQLNPLQMARYDAFRFVMPPGVHPELRQSVYRCWQHTKVMSVAEIFLRTQGEYDFAGKPRLMRVMTDVLTFVSTEVKGRHLSLAQGQILLDLTHELHFEVFNELVATGQLSREIIADMEVMHNMRRVEDLRRETESTLNRWRSLIGGPAMSAFLSGTGLEPVLDVREIIERGDYLIVSVPKGLYASEDQNIGLVGLVLHDVAEAMLGMPKHRRRPFTEIVDEAHKYLGEDSATLMRVARKFELSVVTCTPDLAGLVKKDLDLRPAILGIPKTKIVFNMTWHEDTETIARILYSGDYEFHWKQQETELHDGYEWHKVKETSRSTNVQKNWGDGQSVQEGEQVSHQDSRQQGKVQGTAQSEQEARMRGGVDTLSKPKTGHDRPEQQSHADSAQVSKTTGLTKNEQTSDTAGTADGWAKSKTHGLTHQEGGAVGFTESESDKLVPLAKIVRVQQKMELEKAFNDQMEEKRQKIANRDDRQAAVKYPGSRKALEIETIEVKDPFPNPEAQMQAVDWFQRELYGTHDYFHTPNMDPAEHERSLRETLGLQADDPVVIEPEQNGHHNGNGQQNGQANGKHRKGPERPQDNRMA